MKVSKVINGCILLVTVLVISCIMLVAVCIGGVANVIRVMCKSHRE